MDRVAEHSKGSAFVKFEEKQSAEECLNKCNMDDGDDGNVSIDIQKSPYFVNRILIFFSLEISLKSRPLFVSLAVTKGKVPQLLSEKDSARRSPRDKRNLYLAKEGVIVPGSQAADGLSKADLQKRQKAEAEKKAKLRIPHFVVSKTRYVQRSRFN